MELSLVELIVLALATWRITNLFVDPNEGGPWNIIDRLRAAVGWHWSSEQKVSYGTNVVGSALSCFWCASVWFGIAVTLFGLLAAPWSYYILLPFSLSGAAIVIHKRLK